MIRAWPAASLAFHVANLTRNLVLRSESANVPHRGHVMLRSGDVDVRNVAFVGLGRTDKSIPLDDVVVDATDGTVSSPVPQDVENPRGRYAVHFHRNGVVPAAAAPPSKVYGVSTSDPSFTPRHWDHGAGDERLVISDLPILELDGFDGYGNLAGFRLRFNNHNNVDLYKEDPFDYDQDVVPLLPGDNRYAVRLRQAIANLRLWNNEMAFRVRYNAKSDWSGVSAVNRLDYDAPADVFRGHAGAEINFQILDSTFTGLAPGTSYELQVVAGCCAPDASGACGPEQPHSVSPWSGVAGFVTD